MAEDHKNSGKKVRVCQNCLSGYKPWKNREGYADCIIECPVA